MGVAVFGVDTYVPLYVTGGHGGGPKAAAAVVTPVLLTWALVNCVTASLLVRWGFRVMTVLGSVLVVVAFGGLVVCSHQGSSHVVLTLVLALAGLGFGPMSMSYLLAAQGAVRWQQRGIVTGTLQFSRTMGGAVGIQLLLMLFQHHMSRGLRGGAVISIHGGVGSLDLSNPANQRLVASSLVWVFAAMLAVAVVGVLVSMMMADQEVEPVTTVQAIEAGVA